MRQSGKRKGVIRMPQVRDRMVASVVTIEPGTSVVDAAKRMIEQEKGPLPIVEGERPIGIVTDRDIIAHVVAEGRDPTKMTVEDIASQELVGIISEADIRSDEGPLSGGVAEPVSGLTDTVRGATDKLLGRGGEEKQR